MPHFLQVVADIWTKLHVLKQILKDTSKNSILLFVDETTLSLNNEAAGLVMVRNNLIHIEFTCKNFLAGGKNSTAVMIVQV